MVDMRVRAYKGCKNGKWTDEQSEYQGGHSAKTKQEDGSKDVRAGCSGHTACGYTASACLDSPAAWQEGDTDTAGFGAAQTGWRVACASARCPAATGGAES